MDVYMIRHGESQANRDGTHSGWSPVDLTEKGVSQARATAELLKKQSFDRVYVSDVKRAQQTAKVIFPNEPFVYCALLREINNTKMRGKSAEDMLKLFPDIYPACRREFDYSPLGWDCESRAHLRQRAGQLLKFFENERRENGFEKIAAVCHAGLLGACAACVLDTPTHNPPMLCDNASVSVLTFDGKEWLIKAWNISADKL